MSKVQLKPGDYVDTKGMSDEQYHAVAAKFIESGAGEGEYPKYGYADGKIWEPGWSFGSRGGQLWHGFAYEFGGRQLTIDQVLGAVEPEADAITALHEARDVYREALARVRRELGEGYTLVENAPFEPEPQLDMSDPANWREGDVLKFVCRDTPWTSEGHLYTLVGSASEGWVCFVGDTGIRVRVHSSRFRFHHRPAK